MAVANQKFIVIRLPCILAANFLYFCYADTDHQTLAPRRQSLPVPHASPSCVPTWAPSGPLTFSQTASPNRPYHVASQPYSSGYASSGDSDSHITSGARELEAAPHLPQMPGLFDTTSNASQYAVRKSTQTQPGCADQQCVSPARESFQAVPSVNITITGACSCQSPIKQPASPQLSKATELHPSAVLNPEASLAYLHQPAVPIGASSRTGQLHGAEASGTAGLEEEGPGARQAAQQSRETSSAIDTAALQKEVTELRQQVHSVVAGQAMQCNHCL